MSKCIVHIGMHKTGTTAIQKSLASLDDSNFLYARIGHSPNHSIPIFALFSGDPNSTRHLNRDLSKNGSSHEDYLHMVSRELAESVERANGRTLVMSGENIGSLPPQGVGALNEHLKKYFDEIQICGYVRPPGSYMTSRFQEMVRNRTQTRLDFADLYRSYRESFAKFDDVFAKENVHLWKYDVKLLQGGDVVQDFARHIGLDFPSAGGVRANESSSKELISVLFQYNRFCNELGLERVGGGKIRSHASELEGLGNTKFRFLGDRLRPVLASNASDVAWMEDRLGDSLQEDFPENTGQDVSGEEDLLSPVPTLRATLVNALVRAGLPAESLEARDNFALLHQLLTGKWTNPSSSRSEHAPVGAMKRGTPAASGRKEERPSEMPGWHSPVSNRNRDTPGKRGMAPERDENAPRKGKRFEQAMPNSPSDTRAAIREMMQNPRPLLNADKYLTVIWAPKSACTSVYVWFSFVSGFLDEVKASNRLPHRHRIEVYYRSELYARSLNLDPFAGKVIKIIRDPYERAASVFRHALKTRTIDEPAMAVSSKHPASEVGISFQFFLDILASREPATLNVHLRPQFHPLEQHKTADYVINISKRDLFEGLNKVSEDLGLPRFGEEELKWLHDLEGERKESQVVMAGESLDEMPITREMARQPDRFPSYRQLLTPAAREKIRQIFAIDFAKYGEYL
jgi:hypothetical protein